MKISVHLREGSNKTNIRSEALAQALESHGERVERLSRCTPARDSDLVIQTGFGRSEALLDAFEREVPYIIMEAPFFRDMYDINTASSWGYNGLAGGAWRPDPPDEERPKPILQPMKTEGKTLIIGQKPTDHSLRGTDHVQWILDVRKEYPDAEFRPHPLMVPNGNLSPIKEALRDVSKTIIYTSTVGVDALIEGSQVRADHWGAVAYRISDREEWLHNLSWGQAYHCDMGQLVPFILDGYAGALERMVRGICEIPRERIDGRSICQRYYREIIC